jgi:hypothetical protein
MGYGPTQAHTFSRSRDREEAEGSDLSTILSRFSPCCMPALGHGTTKGRTEGAGAALASPPARTHEEERKGLAQRGRTAPIRQPNHPAGQQLLGAGSTLRCISCALRACGCWGGGSGAALARSHIRAHIGKEGPVGTRGAHHVLVRKHHLEGDVGLVGLLPEPHWGHSRQLARSLLQHAVTRGVLAPATISSLRTPHSDLCKGLHHTHAKTKRGEAMPTLPKHSSRVAPPPPSSAPPHRLPSVRRTGVLDVAVATRSLFRYAAFTSWNTMSRTAASWQLR